ncbi:hypothetical protein C0993_008009 [Termitomyces sp. T159_Od127]|nr:hypothetical protein C0993_008009 [Termitomyces sp. T159_Od127]
MWTVVEGDGTGVCFSDRPGGGGLIVKELKFQWSIEGVMGEVELVTNKHAGGPTVNEGSEDLWGVSELGINDEQPGRLQAELQGGVEVVSGAGWGSDIEGNGLQVLPGLVVKVEGEMFPVNMEVSEVEPGEAQDKGGGCMQMGHEQPEVLPLTVGKGESGLYIVSDNISGGRAAIKEGEVDGEG